MSNKGFMEFCLLIRTKMTQRYQQDDADYWYAAWFIESRSTDTMTCLTRISKLCPKIGVEDHLAVSLGIGSSNQEFWFDYLRPEEDHEEEPWDRNETFHNLDGGLTSNFKGWLKKHLSAQKRYAGMTIWLPKFLGMWMGSTKINGSPHIIHQWKWPVGGWWSIQKLQKPEAK